MKPAEDTQAWTVPSGTRYAQTLWGVPSTHNALVSAQTTHFVDFLGGFVPWRTPHGNRVGLSQFGDNVDVAVRGLAF